LNPKNKGIIQIESVDLPEGPIRIKRCNPSHGESFENKKTVTISSKMIWRLANAIRPNQPLSVDRILGASYNTRSVLETLLAHTPQFYYCYPGRIESVNSNNSIKKGHKHLLWHPNEPHVLGFSQKIETEIVISEVQWMQSLWILILREDMLKYK